mmetsp:Transcript_89193/g.199461  ORF Transcript_89193/g.199461 Transcript_89193/m.199461 type:complete len:274 (-) Transcript_89193:39-860(-)
MLVEGVGLLVRDGQLPHPDTGKQHVYAVHVERGQGGGAHVTDHHGDDHGKHGHSPSAEDVRPMQVAGRAPDRHCPQLREEGLVDYEKQEADEERAALVDQGLHPPHALLLELALDPPGLRALLVIWEEHADDACDPACDLCHQASHTVAGSVGPGAAQEGGQDEADLEGDPHQGHAEAQRHHRQSRDAFGRLVAEEEVQLVDARCIVDVPHAGIAGVEPQGIRRLGQEANRQDDPDRAHDNQRVAPPHPLHGATGTPPPLHEGEIQLTARLRG